MSAIVAILSQDLDDYWISITTADGNANKLTLEDTALYEKVPDWINDSMVVYLPTGPTLTPGTAETRIATSLSSTTLTVKSIFSAKVVSGVTYEIHRLATYAQKLIALRNATPLIFPGYHTVVRDTSLKTIDNKYEYDISSLSIHNNHPHQVLISQYLIKNIWVKNTAYVVGDYIRPTTLAKFTGYIYKCTTAGTSHATTEPTWPTTIAATVADGVGALVWTCQSELDYSNYPMLPLHDWDITPDGRLFFNTTYTAGYTLCIVGIKPLAFTGSGTTETIELNSPHTYVLAAAAEVYLCQAKKSSAVSKDTQQWDQLLQICMMRLAERKIQFPMHGPDGTLISGAGLTV